jgi:ligand-binding SRPBCC domain-containing protein
MTILIEKSDRDPSGFRLTTELLVRESREQLFEFFADAFQLETLTPPWLRFSVQTPRPIDMHAGTMIDYTLRLHGWPIRWRSKISAWEPPFQFIDEQVRGPYRYWHHLHTFDKADGGTLVRDVVHYAVPLGFIMHPLLVRRDLTRIFQYRREAMSRLFTPVSHSVESPVAGSGA